MVERVGHLQSDVSKGLLDNLPEIVLCKLQTTCNERVDVCKFRPLPLLVSVNVFQYNCYYHDFSSFVLAHFHLNTDLDPHSEAFECILLSMDFPVPCAIYTVSDLVDDVLMFLFYFAC